MMPMSLIYGVWSGRFVAPQPLVRGEGLFDVSSESVVACPQVSQFFRWRLKRQLSDRCSGLLNSTKLAKLVKNNPTVHLKFSSFIAWDGVPDPGRWEDLAMEMIWVIVMVGVEDCLLVNIYAPKSNPGNKMPVMVWIHGGSLITGSNRCSQDIANIWYALQETYLNCNIQWWFDK